MHGYQIVMFENPNETKTANISEFGAETKKKCEKAMEIRCLPDSGPDKPPCPRTLPVYSVIQIQMIFFIVSCIEN